MKFLPLAFALLTAATPSFAHKIISIADGDTLTLLVDRHPLKIRLANIDAPEKAQAFGKRARQSLSDLCWGKDATYTPQTVDRYGRTVAVVRCAGVEVNRAQVERGMVWVYERYNRDPSLNTLQGAAKRAQRGLWADKAPTPPWEFRHSGGAGLGARIDSPCHTGPRGGRYQITSGKKRYGC